MSLMMLRDEAWLRKFFDMVSCAAKVSLSITWLWVTPTFLSWSAAGAKS